MPVDVAIVGAGLVGLSLAAALRGCGLRIAIIDVHAPTTSADDDWDSRIYAISPGSRDLLEACGVWQDMRAERIERVEAMHVHGDIDTAALEFRAYDAGRAELCYIIESREIQQALTRAIVDRDDIATYLGAPLNALTFTERDARLELADQRAIDARLVVAADGVDSWVRPAAGIECKMRDYGQIGVVANFASERHHGWVARQWFRNDGVLALLPMPGNRVSMVWSTFNAAGERLLGLDRVSLDTEVTQAAGGVLGQLTAISRARGFPLRMLSVANWVRPRLALVGDAAHCVHPLAGQGVNLGFQDAGLLANVLKVRGPQDDCGDYRLLRRYERGRREPVALMQFTTDALQRLFNNRVPGLRRLRNGGLALTNNLLPIKRMLVEHALG